MLHPLGPAAKVAELLALLHPVLVSLAAGLRTHHTHAHLALHAPKLPLEGHPHCVSAYCGLVVALTAPTVGARTPSAVLHTHKIDILLVAVPAILHAERAVVQLFGNLARLTTSHAHVVVEALKGSEQLTAHTRASSP